MMTVVTRAERNNSYVKVSNWQCETRNSATDEIECAFSNTWQRLAKFYRNNISLQERRQLTVAASKGRLDYKTSSVIREQEEEMLNVLELPVSS